MRSVVITPRDQVAEEIVDRFRNEPAPFLAILHALQDRDGYLRESALEAVAHQLHIEPGDLYGVVTFYHYFRLAKDAGTVEVCGGPACRLLHGPAGEAELRSALVARMGADGVRSIPCPGLCDRPVAAHRDGMFFPAVASDGTFGPGDEKIHAGKVLLAHAHHADQVELAAARRRGAYGASSRGLAPDEILSELEKSGLAGRGGAGFPAAVKWRAVRAAEGSPKYVVVNADEGEPGTFKDRVILEHDPHLLLEGIVLAAGVVGATVGIIYLRYEYPHALTTLERAIAEASAAGLLGGVRIVVRRGAGAYICGEETSLLNSLEGKKPFPRDKPPYPVTHGFDGKPTVVSNVETLAAVPKILEMGAADWLGLGRRGQPGTKLYSISGDVVRPGTYEAPFGSTVREIIDEHAGGLRPGRSLRAFTLGGLSGGLLPASEVDLPLDFEHPKARGAMLGSGGVVVVDDSHCVVDFVRGAMEFFRDESCGKCFPCRVGTERIVERLDALALGKLTDPAKDELSEIATIMMKLSACGLGIAAPAPLVGLLKYFPTEVEEHRSGRCAHGVCGHRAPAPLHGGAHHPAASPESETRRTS